MSFSWSTSPLIPSFTGMKPTTTNSFADALKRLAEHVEEKNKNIDTNTSGTASVLVQSSADFSNRMNPSYVNSSIPPEQALRLYTQYIQETERREDMRRSYLRAYNGSDNPNMNVSTLNRRLDTIDPLRFTAPHLSNPLHPSAYLQSLSSQSRMPSSSSSSLFFSNLKPVDPTIIRTSTLHNVEKKFEQSLKPKSKLFRPYDLDSPNSISRQSSLLTVPKKSTSSPSMFLDPLPTVSISSSGKEKQLFNSLGLVQQSTDLSSESSSLIVDVNEDSISIETTTTTPEENNFEKDQEESSSIKLKRKSLSSTKTSSHRKQSKVDTIQNTMP